MISEWQCPVPGDGELWVTSPRSPQLEQLLKQADTSSGEQRTWGRNKEQWDSQTRVYIPIR